MDDGVDWTVTVLEAVYRYRKKFDIVTTNEEEIWLMKKFWDPEELDLLLATDFDKECDDGAVRMLTDMVETLRQDVDRLKRAVLNAEAHLERLVRAKKTVSAELYSNKPKRRAKIR